MERHPRWRRVALGAVVGVAAPVGLVTASSAYAAPLALLPALVLILLVGVVAAKTQLWRRLRTASAPVQWTAAGVVAAGEGLCWLVVGAAALAGMAAAAALYASGRLLRQVAGR